MKIFLRVNLKLAWNDWGNNDKKICGGYWMYLIIGRRLNKDGYSSDRIKWKKMLWQCKNEQPAKGEVN